MNFQEPHSDSGEPRVPYSFWIFMINIAVFMAVLLTSIILSGIDVSARYASLVVMPMLIAVTLLSSGVYAGWKYRSVDERRIRLNRIGLWGNVLLYAITILFLIGINGFRFLQM